MRHQPAPGPKPKLSAEQRAQLPSLLAKGAESYGFVGEVWTAPRVATVIRREFDVSYHPAHLSRLLRQLDWSVQQPVTRATQRDEAAIDQWWQERWPTLKKTLRQTDARSSG